MSHDPVYDFLVQETECKSQEGMYLKLARPGGLLERVHSALPENGDKIRVNEDGTWLCDVSGDKGEFLSEYAATACSKMLEDGFLDTFDPDVVCRDGEKTTVERWYRWKKGWDSGKGEFVQFRKNHSLSKEIRKPRRRQPDSVVFPSQKPLSSGFREELREDDSEIYDNDDRKIDYEKVRARSVLRITAECNPKNKPNLLGGALCYPTLDQADAHTAELLKNVVQELAKHTGKEIVWFVEYHEKIHDIWSEVIAKWGRKLLNMGNDFGGVNKTNLIRRRNRYIIKQDFAPLSNNILIKILGLTPSNIDQNKSRYYKALDTGTFINLEKVLKCEANKNNNEGLYLLDANGSISVALKGLHGIELGEGTVRAFLNEEGVSDEDQSDTNTSEGSNSL